MATRQTYDAGGSTSTKSSTTNNKGTNVYGFGGASYNTATGKVTNPYATTPANTNPPSGYTTAYGPTGSTTVKFGSGSSGNSSNSSSASSGNSGVLGAGGTFTPITNNRFTGSGGGSKSASSEEGSYVSGGGGSSGGSDNWIKQLILDGWEKAKQLIENQYQQRMEQARIGNEADTRAINKNFMLNNKRIRNMYGDSSGGTGFSNMASNSQNWASKLADARRNYSQLQSDIANTRDSNYLNSLNTIANQYSNYVLNWDYAKMMADLNRG